MNFLGGGGRAGYLLPVFFVGLAFSALSPYTPNSRSRKIEFFCGVRQFSGRIQAPALQVHSHLPYEYAAAALPGDEAEQDLKRRQANFLDRSKDGGRDSFRPKKIHRQTVAKVGHMFDNQVI